MTSPGARETLEGVSPLEIADTLHANSTRALKALPDLRRAAVKPEADGKEYAATLGDIEAKAHLGLYFAEKIRGACDLALFDKTGDEKQKAAVAHLDAALTHWTNYPRPTPARMSSRRFTITPGSWTSRRRPRTRPPT